MKLFAKIMLVVILAAPIITPGTDPKPTPQPYGGCSGTACMGII